MDDTESPPSKRAKTSSPEPEDSTSLHSTLVELSSSMKALASNQEKLLADNARLNTAVNALTKQVRELKNGLSTANQMLASIHKGQKRLNRVFHDPCEHIEGGEAQEMTGAVPSIPPLNANGEGHPPPATAYETTAVEQTPVKSERSSMGSDNNLYLVDLLIKLRDYGCINVDNISKSAYPREIVKHTGNTSYVRYCLELIEFVASTNDGLSDCIRTLADDTVPNAEVIQNVAEILVNACAEKIEEFDNKKVRKKTAIGFGSRIRDYKKRIVLAQEEMHPGESFSVENVELMEREELDELMRVKQEGGEEETDV